MLDKFVACPNKVSVEVPVDAEPSRLSNTEVYADGMHAKFLIHWLSVNLLLNYTSVDVWLV